MQQEVHIPKFRMKRGAKKKIDGALFRNLYYEENKTLEEIGEMFSVSKQAICKIAKGLGIQRRTPIQARDLGIQLGRPSLKQYHVNTQFFSEWSPKMAYVLGFIYADGTIFSKKDSWGGLIGLTIGQKDKEHLEKIKGLMEAEQPITTNKKGLHLISICHKQIGDDLVRLGLTPNKSLTVKFPEIPEEYIMHFIRGVFDGDGSVKSGRFTIGTGSKSFAEGLRQRLVTKLQVDPQRVQLREETYTYRKNPFYVVMICAKGVLQRLYHEFYDNAGDDICFTSKRETFWQLISKMS